ncbi:hypothetical protein BH09BAC3_BH09BAC3_34330 [soil metagenome]
MPKALQNRLLCLKFTFIKKNTFAAYCCLAGICLIWGSTFLVLRMGVKDFPPFLFAGIRQITAGLLLTFYMILIMKASLPPMRHILKLALVGFLLITLGNGLVSWAAQYVSSSVAAIICSAMPVWVILINLTVNKTERPNFMIVIGVVAGLLGIMLVFNEHLADFSDPKYFLGIVLIIIASISWAIASYMMKRSNLEVNPFLNAGFQMIFGGTFCFPMSLVFDDYSNISCQPLRCIHCCFLF